MSIANGKDLNIRFDDPTKKGSINSINPTSEENNLQVDMSVKFTGSVDNVIKGEPWSATVDFSKQRMADPYEWEIISMTNDMVLIQNGDDKIEITDPEMCEAIISAGHKVGDKVYPEYG